MTDSCLKFKVKSVLLFLGFCFLPFPCYFFFLFFFFFFFHVPVVNPSGRFQRGQWHLVFADEHVHAIGLRAWGEEAAMKLGDTELLLILEHEPLQYTLHINTDWGAHG